MTNPNDLLMGGGVQATKFERIGSVNEGTIVRIGEPRQQKDLMSGVPKTWPDGNPVMVIPVELATEQRVDTDDSGARTLWVQLGSQLHHQLRDAIRRSGAKGLGAGAYVSVTFTSEEPSKVRGGHPKKIYSVTYVPGDPGSAAVMAEPTQAPVAAATPVVTQAPVTPPAPAHAPAGVPAADPGAVAAALAALTPEQRTTLGLPPY